MIWTHTSTLIQSSSISVNLESWHTLCQLSREHWETENGPQTLSKKYPWIKSRFISEEQIIAASCVIVSSPVLRCFWSLLTGCPLEALKQTYPALFLNPVQFWPNQPLADPQLLIETWQHNCHISYNKATLWRDTGKLPLCGWPQVEGVEEGLLWGGRRGGDMV